MSLEEKLLERIKKSMSVMSESGAKKFASMLLDEVWGIPSVRERIVDNLIIVVADVPEQKKRGRKPKDEQPIVEKPKPKKPEPKQQEAVIPVDLEDDDLMKAISGELGATKEEEDDNLGAELF